MHTLTTNCMKIFSPISKKISRQTLFKFRISIFRVLIHFSFFLCLFSIFFVLSTLRNPVFSLDNGNLKIQKKDQFLVLPLELASNLSSRSKEAEGITQILWTRMLLAGFQTIHPSSLSSNEKKVLVSQTQPPDKTFKKNFSRSKARSNIRFLLRSRLERSLTSFILTLNLQDWETDRILFRGEESLIYPENLAIFEQVANPKNSSDLSLKNLVLKEEEEIFTWIETVFQKLLAQLKNESSDSSSTILSSLIPFHSAVDSSIEIVWAFQPSFSLQDELKSLRDGMSTWLRNMRGNRSDLTFKLSLAQYELTSPAFLPFTERFSELRDYLNQALYLQTLQRNQTRYWDLKSTLSKILKSKYWSRNAPTKKILFLVLDNQSNPSISLETALYKTLITIAQSKGIHVHILGASGIDPKTAQFFSWLSLRMGGDYRSLSYEYHAWNQRNNQNDQQGKFLFRYQNMQLYRILEKTDTTTQLQSLSLGTKLPTIEESKEFLLKEKIYDLYRESLFVRPDKNSLLEDSLEIIRTQNPPQKNSQKSRLILQSNRYKIPIEIPRLSEREYQLLSRWMQEKRTLTLAIRPKPSSAYRVEVDSKLGEVSLFFRIDPMSLRVISPRTSRWVPNFLKKKIDEINENPFFYHDNSLANYWFIEGLVLSIE